MKIERLATDVVIPARNEEETIGPIVRTFLTHPAIGRVFVVIDPWTVDGTRDAVRGVMNTLPIANSRKCHILSGLQHGKGQCVGVGLQRVLTRRVLFCDADITGLTRAHINRLTTPHLDLEQAILVPNTRDELPPPAARAWQWVSGQRSLPTGVAVSVELHGYLMEEQLNQAMNASGQGTRFYKATDMYSRYLMTPRRLSEMERDREWGIKHGILK